MRAWGAILVLVILAGCDGSDEQAATSRRGKACPQGWVTDANPAGFTVSYPKGWSARAAADGLIVIENAASTARVVVQPFFLRELVTADAWLEQVPTLFKTVFPAASIASARRRRQQPDEVFAAMTYDASGGRGRARVLCSIDGRSGMFYAVAALDADFENSRETLVKVLETFSFTPPASSQKKAPAVQWVRWKDPKQDAFSVEVPRAWSVTGGTIHRNAVDPRTVIMATSPDGQISITGGDAQVPTFTLPTPMLAQAGFTEGSLYSPGYGVVMQVARHMPGAAFAKWYVTARLPEGHTGLAFTNVRDRADAVKAINNVYAQFPMPAVRSSLSAGDVAFTCKRGPTQVRGYYFASTRLTQTAGGGGIWGMESLYGYMAAAGKETEARAILARMVKTFRLNPTWVAKQQNLTANVSKIVSSTNDAISKIIDDTYRSRQAVEDDIARKWSNTTLGQTDVVDPASGKTWKVSNDHNYYWRREGTGEVVGSETADRPDTDFTPLREW